MIFKCTKECEKCEFYYNAECVFGFLEEEDDDE